MGIEIDNDTLEGSAQEQQAQQAQGQASYQQTQKPSFVGGKTSLSFSSHTMTLMSGSKGSEYTSSIAKAMEEAFKTVSNSPSEIKINVLDNSVFRNLKYSTIVTSVDCGKAVSYHTILLEATGDRVFTAADVMGEVANANKNPNGQNAQLNYWSPDDANNIYLHNEIRQVLAKVYPGKTLKSVDALVLPKEHGDIAAIAEQLASVAFNACVTEWYFSTETVSDLNVGQALSEAGKGKILRIKSDMRGIEGTNPFGAPFRADWKLNLSIGDINQTWRELNVQSGDIPLVETAGFVEAIPETVVIPQQPGFPALERTSLHPNIVITSINPLNPTPCYMLLGLITSLVMTNPGMYMKALPLKDNKNQFGSLNVFTALTKDDNNNPTRDRLDLTSKHYTMDKVYNVGKQMFTLSPMVSMDIAAAGYQTYYTSILATAANPNNPNNIRVNAINELIAQLNWLTNGAFPLDFPVNEVFNNNGVVIPLGEWSDKTGLRDLRDIDLAFIAGHSDNDEMLNKWVLTNLPGDITGLDPFLTRVDIISKLIPDARITGKAVRVTFTGKFIAALSNAAVSVGLDPRYETEVKFISDNNIGIMSNYLTNAGVQNAYGFAREYAPQGVNFSTPYVTTGAGRFGGY